MKICRSCSAHNSDERSVCVDCGERLGAPLDEQEAEQMQAELRKNTEKLYNGEDPLHVNVFDKIVGVLCALGCLAGFGVWIGGLVQAGNCGYIIGGIILLFAGAVDCFVPQLMWELEELRLSLVTDGATPGGLYGLFRRGGELVCLLAGVGSILFSVLG